jgi:hypothetical protein
MMRRESHELKNVLHNEKIESGRFSLIAPWNSWVVSLYSGISNLERQLRGA